MRVSWQGSHAALLRWCAEVCGKSLQEALYTLAGLNAVPAARCAAETAVLDLQAQVAGIPLARLLNADAVPQVAVNTVVGSIDGDLQGRVNWALKRGFQVLKIKLGVHDPEQEIRALGRIAASLPDAALLRLDANRAWSTVRARRMLDELAGLPVDSLEEPLRRPDPGTMDELQNRVPWPLALDESVPSLLGKPQLSSLRVRRLVLKPMLLGGLRPAVTIAREAARSGMSCVVTTTVDSAVGTLAALHLAAAIEPRLAHGLDTGAWLETNTGRSPAVIEATMQCPQVAGLGFQPGPMLSAA